MTNLPARYQFLTKPPGATMLVDVALTHYGTLEGAGTANNPKIINWADIVARKAAAQYNNWAADWYNKDSVPWCGLFMALCVVDTNRKPVGNYLSALAWADFGNPVQFKGREGLRLNEIKVGDVAVFVRNGGGHVAIVVGVTSDGKAIVCIGGNQDNAVNIKQFPIGRLYAVRRPPYKVTPAGARHVRLTSTGVVSRNEQ